MIIVWSMGTSYMTHDYIGFGTILNYNLKIGGFLEHPRMTGRMVDMQGRMRG